MKIFGGICNGDLAWCGKYGVRGSSSRLSGPFSARSKLWDQDGLDRVGGVRQAHGMCISCFSGHNDSGNCQSLVLAVRKGMVNGDVGRLSAH